MVRYRVNYNPKGFKLGATAQDPIGVVVPPEDSGEDGRVVGPKVTSLFGMLMRVWRLERWQGLFKGFSESSRILEDRFAEE